MYYMSWKPKNWTKKTTQVKEKQKFPTATVKIMLHCLKLTLYHAFAVAVGNVFSLINFFFFLAFLAFNSYNVGLECVSWKQIEIEMQIYWQIFFYLTDKCSPWVLSTYHSRIRACNKLWICVLNLEHSS